MSDFDFEAMTVDDLSDVGLQGSKKRTVVRPPDAIIAIAQASRDNRRRYEKAFPTAEIAKHFADLMRNAGEFTEPKSGMYVHVVSADDFAPAKDADEAAKAKAAETLKANRTRIGKVVVFAAGEPRGRKGKDEPNGSDDASKDEANDNEGQSEE